jgi:hypothetical protein
LTVVARHVIHTHFETSCLESNAIYDVASKNLPGLTAASAAWTERKLAGAAFSTGVMNSAASSRDDDIAAAMNSRPCALVNILSSLGAREVWRARRNVIILDS